MKKEVLASGKYLSLVKRDGYEMVERINCTGIAVLLPLTDDGKVVLVEQFRPPVQKKCIELPAGLVRDLETAQGESIEAAALRELEEETGYLAENLEKIGFWPTSSGMSSEMVTVFKATGLKRVGAGGGDATENITVHVVSLREIDAWLKNMSNNGFLIDPKVYAGLYLL